jgi:hypothetical protein
VPLDTRRTGPRRDRSNVEVATSTDTPIVTQVAPRIRPLCRAVGAYCEALYWLQREPYGPAAVCCRHYWATVEDEPAEWWDR